ncbi:PcfJ domain-containing protein [Bacillus mesophilum]|uniref:PcfJ-like protein n=1 Tax=Bacillus mesophilum TaxID=1071718 RepID=A0A7V7RJA2_9BACI|nr:PcfJ domain-containing protein [Bacillus mesophilum]KAB2329469.1 hypothetical protein F7732_21325 [Bacillus mesophilum]
MKGSTQEAREFLQHFPEGYSDEIHDYINNTVLLESRYIFTYRKGKQQFGYCTHCHKDFRTEGLKHKGFTVCPKCQSNCRIQASGLGRKFMFDDGYAVFYEKSEVDPTAIIARGIYVYRNYKDDYRKVETSIKLYGLYLFKPGQSQFYANYGWNDSFTERKSVFSLKESFPGTSKFCPRNFIENAVNNTLFQYSTWEDFAFRQCDMTEFFSLFSNYPCIEYLSKMGLKSMVEAKLFGRKTNNAINWRGKTIDKVLKLEKNDIKTIRPHFAELSTSALRLYQLGKKDGSKLSIDEALSIGKELDTVNDLNPILKLRPTNIKKVIKYLRKQLDKDKKKHYYRMSHVLSDWKDYINDCKKLLLDLDNEMVIFPSNLYTAHQNTNKQIKYEANDLLDRHIKNRMNKLKVYEYSDSQFVIRPAASTRELINEGAALNHCVGGYAEDYAYAKTTILLIREKTNQEAPFYTVEVKKGKIKQVRGKGQRLPTKEVQQFIDRFENSVLNRKKSTSGRKTG